MKLNIKDDSGKTTVVPITRDEITIGRKEGNTIRLTERNVSRTHARFLKRGDEIHIEDVSRYGTRVNGERITETRRVGAGDLIQIGDYVLSLEGVKPVEAAADAKLAAAAAAATQTMTEFRGNEKKRAEVEAAAKNQIAAAKAEMRGDEDNRGNKKKGKGGAASKDPQADEVTGQVPVEELRQSRGAGKKRIGAAYPTLVAVTTHLAGSEFPITGDTMVLGRTGENDIKVDHHSISRNHAKVVAKNGKIRMVDLQSKNGIRVNGEFWEESTLKSGDIIELGKVQFRFVEKGEEFIFRPEDFAEAVAVDEKKKKGGKGFLALFLLLAAGGLAAVYFLVIAKPSEKPNVPNVPVATGTPPPATTAPTTTAPTTKAAEPDVAVAPDTQAAAQKDTAVAPPPDNTAKIKDLMDKAQAASKARKWDEAQDELNALLALDAGNEAAKTLAAKVASEKAVGTLFAEAQAAQAKEDLPGAWAALQKLAAMPADSVYAPQVTEMKKAVGAAIANGLVDEAKQALTKKDWKTAIDKAEEAIKVQPNHPEAGEVITKARRVKLEEARKEAAAKEKENPEPPPPKEDSKKTADELYKEARALHNTDEAAALKLYEQAAAKGHTSAHKFIASIKIRRGDKDGAIASYAKYLQLVPNARDADTVREIIKNLGGTPP